MTRIYTANDCHGAVLQNAKRLCDDCCAETYLSFSATDKNSRCSLKAEPHGTLSCATPECMQCASAFWGTAGKQSKLRFIPKCWWDDKKWLNFGVHFCWFGIMCMLLRYNIPSSKSAVSRHQAFWVAFYHVTMIFNNRSHKFTDYRLVVFLVWNWLIDILLVLIVWLIYMIIYISVVCKWKLHLHFSVAQTQIIKLKLY